MALVALCRKFSSRVTAGRFLCHQPDQPCVLTETKGELFIISLNRPEKRNCVNKETAKQLLNAFHEFDNNDDARVAVLHGVGGNFCAGYDLQELSAVGDNKDWESLIHPAPMGPTHLQIKKPVIAAIDGYAVAGGLELALHCDLRIVEENAILGVYCRRFGVPLIDGGTVRLPAVIGLGRALDLILTGRSVTAKEALEMGLATQVVDVGTSLGQAVNLAKSIARFPPKCVKADRRSVYHSVFSAANLEEALRFEYENAKDIITEEGVDGAQLFVKGMGRHGKANVRSWLSTNCPEYTKSSLLD